MFVYLTFHWKAKDTTQLVEKYSPRTSKYTRQRRETHYVQHKKYIIFIIFGTICTKVKKCIYKHSFSKVWCDIKNTSSKVTWTLRLLGVMWFVFLSVWQQGWPGVPGWWRDNAASLWPALVTCRSPYTWEEKLIMRIISNIFTTKSCSPTL